jgi:hypothetical protein
MKTHYNIHLSLFFFRKKSTISLDRIPKKQLSKDATPKIPKIQDNTSTNKCM